MISFFSKLLLVFIIPFSLESDNNGFRHPFHVSTTEVNVNAKTKSLEVTCRVFSDDFEDALTKVHKTKIDLHKGEMDHLVKKYLESNLKFTVNNKLVKFEYLGYENDHEATVIYLEVKNVSWLKTLKLYNTVLYDSFDDQMNILHINNKGVRKSTKISYPEKEVNLSF